MSDKVRLFVVACNLLCVTAAAQYLVGVTRTELLLALVSECQNVFTDYVKLSFISECQIELNFSFLDRKSVV